jgi:hypothetical protein
MVKPVAVYGSETWPMTDMDMKRLNMWKGKTIKRIYIYIHGPVVEQGIQRIRAKWELWNLYEDFDLISNIIKKRLEWL